MAVAPPKVASPKLGDLLENRYLIRKELGRGASGTVYLAQDTLRDRNVAVKFMHGEIKGGDGDLPSMFQREFRAISALNHPNTITVFDLYANFFTMEYIDGTILETKMAADINGLLKIGIDICRALGYIHRTGLIHGDLKPAHVMIDRRGSVKLIDFGLAKEASVTSAVTMDDMVIQGTIEYMAPEQIKGLGADPRSDLYSLGVLLYELATGRKPFEGSDFLQLAMHHLHTTPVQPSRIAPKLPAQLDQLILKLLEKSPTDRYQGAEEVGRTLLALSGDKEVRERSMLTGAQYLFAPSYVGREVEMILLNDFLGKASEGEGKFVFLRGLSGIGKTRLLKEFKAANLFSDNVIIISGRPSSRNGTAQPFFVELLDQAFRALARFDSDRLMELLWEWALALGGFQAEARPDWFVENIVIICAQMPKVAIGMIITLIRDLMEFRTVIILADDAETVSGFGGQLLEAMAELAVESRCLVCAAYNEEVSAGNAPLAKSRSRIKAAGRCVEVTLNALDLKNMTFFIESMVSQSELERTLVKNIAEITKGNPLFIQETVKSLATQHVISRQGTTWVVDEKKLKSFKLPTELEGILMSRLEGLGKTHRGVLFTMAAARGATSFQLLRRLTHLSELDLFYVLGDLQTRGLVKAIESEREYAYVMTNDRVASKIYQEGKEKDKRKLHALIAEEIEKRVAHRIEPVLDELIYHHLASGEVAKAIQLMLRAGEIAEGRGLYHQAAEHYRSGLKRVDRDRSESSFVELCLRTGRVNRILGSLDVAASYLLKGLDLAEAKTRVSAELAHELGVTHYLQGNSNEAIRYLHYGLNVFESQGIPNARLRIDFGRIYYDVGNWTLAEQYLTEARSLLLAGGPDMPKEHVAANLARCFALLAEIALSTQRFEAAREHLATAIAHAEQSGDPAVTVLCHVTAGKIFSETYDLERASFSVNAALAMADRVEDRWILTELSYLQGLLNANRGYIERAIQQAEHGVKLAAKMDSKWQMGRIQLLHARLLLERDARKRACEVCREAGLILGAAGDKLGSGTAEMLLGRAARLDGEYDNALTHLDHAQELFKLIGAQIRFAETELEEAQVHLKREEPEEAFRLLRGTLERIGTSGNWWLEGKIRSAMAAATVEAGDQITARSGYLKVIEIFRCHNAQLELAKVQEEFGLYLLGGMDRPPSESEQDKGFEALTEAVALFGRSGLEGRSQKAEMLLKKFQRQARSRELTIEADLDKQYDIAGSVDRMKKEMASRLDGIAKEVTMPDESAMEDTKKFVDEKIKGVESSLQYQLDEMKSINDRLKRDIAFLMEEKQSLSTLQKISHAINSETDLDRLITMIIDMAIEQVHAERGFLILRNADGKFIFREARNIDQHTIQKPEFKVSFTIAKRVVKTGDPILTANAQEDARFKDKISVHDLKLKSVLCVPLKQSSRIMGAVYVDNRFVSGLFAERDLDILWAIASQAAVALEKAQLLYENRVKKQEVEKLNEQLARKYRMQQDELMRLKEELRRSREAMTLKYDYSHIIGNTPGMRAIFKLLDKVTDTNVPVLIEGESGTGKELVARALHFNGPLKDMPFAAENCAALSETLLESELFGHVRGSFTGADRDKKGLFEIANGGTLFLDEVGEMSPNMQKKLLRVLQEGEVRPVGGKQIIPVKVRIIAATNKPLDRLRDEGRFREDLYYRLNVVTIKMPPLRERIEDLPLLVDHFLTNIAEKSSSPKYEVEPDAMRLMMRHGWPGNVRELENELARSIALSDGGVITKELLSPSILGVDGASAGHAPAAAVTRGPRLLKDVERDTIIATLRAAGGNKVEAARMLGIDRTTLYNKMRRYKIDG